MSENLAPRAAPDPMRETRIEAPDATRPTGSAPPAPPESGRSPKRKISGKAILAGALALLFCLAAGGYWLAQRGKVDRIEWVEGMISPNLWQGGWDGPPEPEAMTSAAALLQGLNPDAKVRRYRDFREMAAKENGFDNKRARLTAPGKEPQGTIIVFSTPSYGDDPADGGDLRKPNVFFGSPASGKLDESWRILSAWVAKGNDAIFLLDDQGLLARDSMRRWVKTVDAGMRRAGAAAGAGGGEGKPGASIAGGETGNATAAGEQAKAAASPANGASGPPEGESDNKAQGQNAGKAKSEEAERAEAEEDAEDEFESQTNDRDYDFHGRLGGQGERKLVDPRRDWLAQTFGAAPEIFLPRPEHAQAALPAALRELRLNAQYMRRAAKLNPENRGAANLGIESDEPGRRWLKGSSRRLSGYLFFDALGAAMAQTAWANPQNRRRCEAEMRRNARLAAPYFAQLALSPEQGGPRPGTDDALIGDNHERQTDLSSDYFLDYCAAALGAVQIDGIERAVLLGRPYLPPMTLRLTDAEAPSEAAQEARQAYARAVKGEAGLKGDLPPALPEKWAGVVRKGRRVLARNALGPIAVEFPEGRGRVIVVAGQSFIAPRHRHTVRGADAAAFDNALFFDALTQGKKDYILLRAIQPNAPPAPDTWLDAIRRRPVLFAAFAMLLLLAAWRATPRLGAAAADDAFDELDARAYYHAMGRFALASAGGRRFRAFGRAHCAKVRDRLLADLRRKADRFEGLRPLLDAAQNDEAERLDPKLRDEQTRALARAVGAEAEDLALWLAKPPARIDEKTWTRMMAAHCRIQAALKSPGLKRRR